MEREVEEYIKSLSDIDLLEYTRCKTHLPEAIEFAEVELAERHLSSGQLAELERQLQQRAKERAEHMQAVASEPLAAEWRLGVFLSSLCFGIPLLLFIPAWLRYREEGAHRKNKDMCIFALAGFCLLAVLLILRIPPWSWLAGLFSASGKAP